MAVVWVAKPIRGPVNDVVGRKGKEVKELEHRDRREVLDTFLNVQGATVGTMSTAVSGRGKNLCPRGGITVKVWMWKVK